MIQAIVVSMVGLMASNPVLADPSPYPAPVCRDGKICVARVSKCRSVYNPGESYSTQATVGLTKEIVCVNYQGGATTILQSVLERISGTSPYSTAGAEGDCERQIAELIDAYGKCPGA